VNLFRFHYQRRVKASKEMVFQDNYWITEHI